MTLRLKLGLWAALFAGFVACRLWLMNVAPGQGPGAGFWLAPLWLVCLAFLAVDTPRLQRQAWVALGLAGLGVTLLALGQMLLWIHDWDEPLHAIWGWCFLALGSALILHQVWENHAKAKSDDSLSPRWEGAALAAILIFALWARLHRLGELPATWAFDEVDLARITQDQVLESGKAPIFLKDFHNPGAYFWVSALLFKIWGVSIDALRALSAFWGFLALLPFYGLSRRMLGRTWGLAALAIFSCMRWTLIPEHIAFTSSFALFWCLSSAYFCWLALDGKRLGDFALAGLSLGMTLHSYNPCRMMILIWLVVAALHMKEWKNLSWKPPALFAACFLAVAAPMLAYMASHWVIYNERTLQSSILHDIRDRGWGQLGLSFLRHLQCFNHLGDANARHNIHGWPQLDFLSGMIFVPALVWVHVRVLKDRRATLLCVWFWIMLLQGILSMASEAPQANRSILVAPAVALICAWFLGDALAPLKAPWPKSLAAVALVSLAAVPLMNAYEYFVVWADDPSTSRYFSPEATDAARLAASQPPGWLIYHAHFYERDPYPQFERDLYIRFALRQQQRQPLKLDYPDNEVPPFQDDAPKGLLLIWAKSDEFFSKAMFQRQFSDIAVIEHPGAEGFATLSAEIPWNRIPIQAPSSSKHPLFWRAAR